MFQQNVSLKPYNTFGIEAKAKHFSIFHSLYELAELLQDAKRTTQHGPFILGGGSNILLTKDVDGVVLKNEIYGIEKIDEDEDHIYIKAGAGENWHQFVLYCLENNYAGVENLAL